MSIPADSAFRKAPVLLSAFTVMSTKGMEVVDNKRSVLVNVRSLSEAPSVLKRWALARSIRCGKSTLNS